MRLARNRTAHFPAEDPEARRNSLSGKDGAPSRSDCEEIARQLPCRCRSRPESGRERRNRRFSQFVGGWKAWRGSTTRELNPRLAVPRVHACCRQKNRWKIFASLRPGKGTIPGRRPPPLLCTAPQSEI